MNIQRFSLDELIIEFGTILTDEQIKELNRSQKEKDLDSSEDFNENLFLDMWDEDFYPDDLDIDED